MRSGPSKHFRAVTGVAFLWAALQPTVLAGQLPSGGVEAIFKENAKAVVLIRTLDAEGATAALGSGFIVAASGTIVTNHHVIEPVIGGRLVVKLSQGDVYDDVSVIHDDPRRDFAVIMIKASGLPYIKLGSVLVGFDAVMLTTSSRYALHGACYSSDPMSCAKTFEDLFKSFAFPGLL